MRKVYLDTEATGTSITGDSIFQVGALVVEDGEIIKAYSRYVQPYVPIGGGAIAVTGVSNQEANYLAGGKTLANIYSELEEELFDEPCEIIGHNVSFDFNLLNNNLKHFKLDMFENAVSTFCTMNSFSYKVTGNGKRAKLSKLYDLALDTLGEKEEDMIEFFEGIVIPKTIGTVRGSNFHDALWDSFCVYIIDTAFR